MRPLRHPILFTMLAATLAAGCRRSREAPAPVLVPQVTTPETATSGSDADAARERAARDAAEREARAREERARIRAILIAPIQFGFDRSDLTLEARSALDAKLEVLRADRTIRIRVDGHADERGSSEYNLALGMRRAAAARRYLVQREIAADRIDISSLGEERQVCETSAEWCWRINRRDEFVMLSP